MMATLIIIGVLVIIVVFYDEAREVYKYHNDHKE